MSILRALYLNVFISILFFVPNMGKISSLDQFFFINDMFGVVESDTILFDKLKNIPNSINRYDPKSNIWQEEKPAIDSMKSVITTLMPLLQKIDEFKLYRDGIISRYDQTVKMENHMDQMDQFSLIEFARWSISHGVQSVRDYLELYHLILFGPVEKTTENFFEDLAEYFEAHTLDSCLDNSANKQLQSAQQVVYYFYNDIIMTELKGLVIMEFSIMILRVYGIGNFTTEANYEYNGFQQRIKRTLTLLKKALKNASRLVWRCDPSVNKEQVTFEQVTELVQGFVVNQVNLSPNTHIKCYDGCSTYDNVRRKNCDSGTLCQEQAKCIGTIHNCGYDSYEVKICIKSLHHGPRRYEYVQLLTRYGSNKLFGRHKDCPGWYPRWSSWWGGIYQCYYCYCHCWQDEDGYGARYFSLRESLSDVRNNKVVTGLRFRKYGTVFHLQIQQGQMLPRGTINSSTVEWRHIKSFNIHYVKANEYFRLRFGGRGFDMNDIESDSKNFVVTGVRLALRTNDDLSLEAKLSKVNSETGKLEPAKKPVSYWRPFHLCTRSSIELNNLDVPTQCYKKSIPTVTDHLKFGPTGDDQDAAQTTIPFIDIQEVFTNPPSPLSGVGIYYKSRPGYGGFIAPRIFTAHVDKFAKIPMIP